MKMISRVLVVCLSLVFSLLVSGPAFSAMACHGHMMRMAGVSGASGVGVDHRAMMKQGKCCQKMGCMSSLHAILQAGYVQPDPVLKAVMGAGWSPLVPALIQSPKLFVRYRQQQGPPLLMRTSYKAFQARTGRQIL